MYRIHIVVPALILALLPSALSAQLRAPCNALANTFALNFSSSAVGTIGDAAGTGTGLRDRLGSTGTAYGATDANLQVNTAAGLLQIRSTDSDINGQSNLAGGEYLGINLSRLGFNGSQDFCVGAQFRDVRYSQSFDQFGLYVGSGSAANFRAGYLFSGARTLFSVLNNAGSDANIGFAAGPAEGSNLYVSIGRIGGQYFFDANGLSMFLGAQPAFLNGFGDLNVGLFAANARNTVAKTATLDDFTARVGTSTVPEPQSIVLLFGGLVAMAFVRGRARQLALPRRILLAE